MSPGHSLEDFGRPKIYMIDHNPSWKENQRQKKESFWIRELQTLHPEGNTNLNEISNDEVYQLAKDQALVKKLKSKRFRPF
jgi:hypothetical protein